MFSSKNKKNTDTFWLKKVPYQALFTLQINEIHKNEIHSYNVKSLEGYILCLHTLLLVDASYDYKLTSTPSQLSMGRNAKI